MDSCDNHFTILAVVIACNTLIRISVINNKFNWVLQKLKFYQKLRTTLHLHSRTQKDQSHGTKMSRSKAS